jgi:hypothetical protein
MGGSAAAMLGLLEAFHCPFIPHSSRHAGSARCRHPLWTLAVRRPILGRESTGQCDMPLLSFFISVLTKPRVGFCHLLARERDATSWHDKKSANKAGGQITVAASHAQVGGFRERTRGRGSIPTFRLSISPAPTREEAYKARLAIPAVELRSCCESITTITSH